MDILWCCMYLTGDDGEMIDGDEDEWAVEEAPVHVHVMPTLA